MRSRKSMLVITMMLLGAEVIPVRLGAQEQKEVKEHHRFKLVNIGTFGGPVGYLISPMRTVLAP